MKRKYMAGLLVLAFSFGLTACGSSAAADETQETADAAETTAEELLGAYEPVLYENLTSTVVTLGQYRGIEMDASAATASDEEVQREVEARVKEYLEPEKVDRAAAEGDVVVIDYTGYVDGETSDGLQGTEYSLELGSGTFISGFEDQLIGAVADENREINLTFPDSYYEDLAGKDVTFEVYVHAVQEYQMDNYTDEFVSENMGYDNIEVFEETVRQELDTEAEANLEYDLVLAFLENCEFDIQEEDVEAYLDEMMSEYATYAVAYGLELEEYLNNYLGVTEAQLREIFRESAEFRVKLTVAFHDVAEAEGLVVSDEEYDEMVNSLVETYGYENADAVETVYTEEKIRESLIQEKVIDLIVDTAILV